MSQAYDDTEHIGDMGRRVRRVRDSIAAKVRQLPTVDHNGRPVTRGTETSVDHAADLTGDEPGDGPGAA